jgi:hypothetical protein
MRIGGYKRMRDGENERGIIPVYKIKENSFHSIIFYFERRKL